MSQIKPEDLFDFDSYLTKINEVDQAGNAFAASTIGWTGRVKQSFNSAETEATQLIERLNSLTDVNKTNASQFSALASQAAESSRKIEQARQAQAGLSQAQELNSKLVTELTQKLADLKTRYDNLDPSAKGYITAQRAILREVRLVSNAIDGQSRTLKAGKAAADAAEGSYQRLSKQTEALRKQLKEMPGAFDESTGALNRNNRAAVDLQKQINKNATALLNADKQMGIHTRNVGNYQSALKGVASQAALTVGGIVGISSAIDALTQSLKIISDMERIDASLKAVSKDSADFAETQQFLIATANSLGLEYEGLAGTFKSLKAATNGTALEGKMTQQVFLGIVRAGAALRLENEDVKGTIKALTDMMSKGRVGAEELKQQLGDRLPGAIRLLSVAMGVSETKLNKMMEQGQLLAADVLPKLASQLDKTYGQSAQDNLNSMSGGWNVMTNEVHLFLAQLDKNEAITNTATAFESMIANTLKGMRLAIQSNEWGTFFKSFLHGPLDITGAGQEARTRMDNMRENDETVAVYRTMTPQQRAARRDITRESRDDAADKLKNRRDEMNSGNVQYYQKIYARDKELLTMLSREEIKLVQKNVKDEAQAKINAQRAAATKAENDAIQNEKNARKAEAARRKANAEEDRKLNAELANQKAGSDNELAQLDKQHQDGLISEQDFIEKRLAMTLRGLEDRMATLRKYHKQETDDYKKLTTEKLEAEAEYQRAQVKTDLSGSKTRTSGKLADLEEKRQEGGISEVDYLDKRRQAEIDGVNDQLRILRDAGQEKTDLYQKTADQLAKIDSTYYKDRMRVLKKEYKDELAEVREGLSKINAESSAKYEEDLQKVQDTYDKLDAEVAKKVARGELTKSEGDKEFHTLRLLRIKEQQAATTAAYESDSRLSSDLVNQKIADLEKIKAAATSPAEIAAAEAQIADLKAEKEKDALADSKRRNKQAADDQKQQTKELTDAEIKEIERLKEKKMALWQLSTDLAQTAGDAVFSIVRGGLDKEQTQLDKQKENELRLAGDNADARAKIEEQYAKKQNEIRRKQAIADREQALFNIAISTAMGVASVLSTGGGTRYADLGISAGLLTAFVIATGGLQAAAVLAKPLPNEFWTGTSHAPEGLAKLAERGPELRQKVDGSYQLYEQPTTDYLGAGDRIFTADQTKRIAADWQKEEASRQAMQEFMLMRESSDRLQRGLHSQAVSSGLSKQDMRDVMADAFASQPVHITNIEERVVRKMLKLGSSYVEYVNERYS